MKTEKQIKEYISSLPEKKSKELETLHKQIVLAMPGCKLWFLDGKDENGKIVSNPNIGYGLQTIKYADGSTKEFYQAGISANTSGISIYIMGLNDKAYLKQAYEKKLGKAAVTSYCIKFKSIKVINIDVLLDAIKDGVEKTS